MNSLDIFFVFIAFIVFFLFFYFVNLNRANIMLKKKKRKRKNEVRILAVSYLVAKFNIKKERLLTKKMITIISLLDAFNIALVFFVTISLPISLIWQMLIGLVLLLGLIYSVLGIFGSILLKRGYDKDEL